ncbi:unnamed protein product [Pleuronectes platessa]|uniref:Uncharacterized protein n=1 Tax=Pleuronectes platessa TaxID=8262 RepID=A0A9N7Y8Y8_PLEPL|nr:unnamed protein product [Pleuronectes platessa]
MSSPEFIMYSGRHLCGDLACWNEDAMRCLLDSVPIKLNKSNGSGREKRVEMTRVDGGGVDIDGIEREREREAAALQGSITRNRVCRVALLLWDSVGRKREIINRTERRRK